MIRATIIEIHRSNVNGARNVNITCNSSGSNYHTIVMEIVLLAAG